MKRLKIILSKVLDIEENTITDSTSPETVDSWDSFNALMMVSELENNFKVKFTMDEVINIKCVKDIINTLNKYGINLKQL